MSFPFHKMEGTGNDFVVVYASDLPTSAGPEAAVAICDRRRGVGADGVLVVGPPDAERVGSMTVWNADGSVAEMCGNGLRCVALRLVEDGAWTGGGSRVLGTGAGEVRATLTDLGVRVTLGTPRLGPTRTLSTPWGPVTGQEVGMGNPHFVVFADDAAGADLRVWGPELSADPVFPDGTNVEHVEVLDRATLRMRVWERGAGETEACGSGACAAVVAARLQGRIDSDVVDVHLSGGALRIRWSGEGPTSLEGPARTVFVGQWPDPGESK